MDRREITATVTTRGDDLDVQVLAEIESGPVQASFVAHDEIDIVWCASVSCEWDGTQWAGTIADWRADSPELMQLVGLTVGNDNKIEPSNGLLLFRNPGADGEWKTDRAALDEWLRLMRSRWERYECVLNVEDSVESDDIYFVMFLADNLLLGSVQKVPGVYVSRVENSSYGLDAATVLSDVMEQRWFDKGIDQDAWTAKSQIQRPVVILEMHQVRASSWQEAGDFGLRTARTLLNLLSMRRHTSARLIAGVVGRPRPDGSIEFMGSASEGSGYAGNLATGLISGEDNHSLQDEWSGLQSDARVRLWAALLSDALYEGSWDYKLFRCFNLLEGIAKEKLAQTTIVNSAGRPRMMAGQGKKRAYTTTQAQGAVYELIRTTCLRGDNSQATNYLVDAGVNNSVPAIDRLWDEVGIWTEIRNDVAHTGCWQFNPKTESTRHREVNTLLRSRSLGGQLGAGTHATLRPLRDAAIAVVTAAIYGRL